MNWMMREAWDELAKHLDESTIEAAPLAGTEKPIAWATDIRESYIAAIEQAWAQMLAQATAAGGTETDIAPYKVKYERILSGLHGIRYAHIWIDAHEDNVNGMAALQMLMSLVK